MLTWRAALALGLSGATLPLWPDPWLGLLVLTVAVLVLSVVDGAMAAPVRLVEVERDGPRTVRLGESATIALRLRNGSTRVLRGQVRDAWVPSAGATPYAHRVWAGPGDTATVVTTLTPTRRGDRPAVRLHLRAYGPLGLAYRQAARGTPQWTLRVLPRFESRRLLPEKLARLRVLDGTTATRGRGQGTEFDALREYVVGDDVRSIDWRGTARSEHVVVRTWRPERDRRVLCVIDTGRTSAGRVGTVPSPGGPPLPGEPRLDAAIDAALLLATLAAHAGDRVDLLAVDTQVRVSFSSSGKGTQLSRLTGALAALQPSLVETDFGRVVAEVLRAERKRALVVIFTTLDPGALGEGLLPVLPQLVAKHTVVVAAVHDPSLEVLAAHRGGADDLYTAAAAERALGELDRVRRALSRYNVHVVDAPAHTFASAVADRYLSLKAAGRL